MRVVVIIPAVNEESTISSVIDSLDNEWQTVVIDDGSTDATSSIAKAAGAHVIVHPTNYGYDRALSTGLNYAREKQYDVAITIDADGQIPPSMVESVIDILSSSRISLVLGYRRNLPRWSEKIYAAYVCRRYGATDILCGLKGYRVSDFDFLNDFSMNYSVGTAVAMAGLRTGLMWEEVHVPVKTRVGKSRFGAGFLPNAKILRAAINTMLNDLRKR